MSRSDADEARRAGDCNCGGTAEMMSMERVRSDMDKRGDRLRRGPDGEVRRRAGPLPATTKGSPTDFRGHIGVRVRETTGQAASPSRPTLAWSPPGLADGRTGRTGGAQCCARVQQLRVEIGRRRP